MKSLEKRIKEATKSKKIRQDIIQQDYLLSWVLVGIFNHPLLQSSLVFKGGTALKKGFFGDYRFSQDLDFSAYSHAPMGRALLQSIEEVCVDSERRVAEFAPIKLMAERYEEKQPHPNEQEAFTIRAQFPWQPGPLTVVMVEISRDEKILLPPTQRQLLHEYGEPIQQSMLVYSLTKIVLEKLRAILQNTKKLHERDWTRSRNRDYYDLWRIFGLFESDLELTAFTALLKEKCALKQVACSGIESFFDPRMIAQATDSWKTWLGGLVSQLPPCEVVLDGLRGKLETLLPTATGATIV